MIQRLDQLKRPVEIGRYYLVPTVRAEWSGRLLDWPVIGPKHNDRHCLNFDHDHYHIDPRFVSEPGSGWNFWYSVQAQPIMSRGTLNPGGLPKPEWRRRLCRRHRNPDVEGLIAKTIKHEKTWGCHYSEWVGRTARRDERGLICPHRNVSLADHAAINGVVICPLHLLKIDVETGIVLPPEARTAGA